MSTSNVPALFAQLVDDAAVFPPGSSPIAEAVTAHRGHRGAWYEPLIGPLLVPVDDLYEVVRHADGGPVLDVGVVGDPSRLGGAPGATSVRVRQVECAVAKRGEDPLPGLRRLLDQVAGFPECDFYAEIPLTWGLLAALDAVTQARAAGAMIAAKFRTGGLAGELFPTPGQLAAVICACRDRRLPFKLTAGLHRAVRHNDPETGFTHHGFLNVLAAAVLADRGADESTVARALGWTDSAPLVDVIDGVRDRQRPLWIGFGSCSIAEPLADLVACGLVDGASA